MRIPPAAAVLCGLLVLCGSSCSGNVAETLREATYPPSTAYVAPAEVRRAMRELSETSFAIDRALRAGERDDATDRKEVLAQLRRMEEAARNVGAGRWTTNHPMISARIDDFFDDVRRAREAVERDPPSYARAGAVAGACVYCHRPR